MKKEESGTVSTFNKTTIIAIALIATIALGSVGLWIYRPSIPGPPPPVIPSETTPTETEPITEPESINTTLPAEPEITNATDTIPETPTIKPIEITAAEFKKLIDKIYTYQIQYKVPDDARTVKRQEVEPYRNQTILVTGMVVTSTYEAMVGTEKYYGVRIFSESNKYYITFAIKAGETVAPKIGQTINTQGLLIFEETCRGNNVGALRNVQIIKDP